ncbi:MAG: hypothetical protein ACOYJJ_04855 [Anaerovoracaceae bacterium]
MDIWQKGALTAALAIAVLLIGAGLVFAEDDPGVSRSGSGAVRAKNSAAPAVERPSAQGADVVRVNKGDPVGDGSFIDDYASISPGRIYLIDSGLTYKTYKMYKLWFPIKPKKTGSLTILTGSGRNYVSLYRPAKKPKRLKRLSGPIRIDTDDRYENCVYYGVKAGRTYYVMTSGNGTALNSKGKYYDPSSKSYHLKFRYENEAYSGKFSTSSRKPSRLKNNKKYRGTIISRGKTRYIKFTKKGKKAVVKLRIKTADRINVRCTRTVSGRKTTKSLEPFTRGDFTETITFRSKKRRKISYQFRIDPAGNSSCVFEASCR